MIISRLRYCITSQRPSSSCFFIMINKYLRHAENALYLAERLRDVPDFIGTDKRSCSALYGISIAM